ncbi:MAG: hypothetical protein GXO71_05920 [Caldiserica bacterium]|nr:hypothetical protein [Caldisericota bacterium]
MLLKAVFWDYPEFLKRRGGKKLQRGKEIWVSIWTMQRFLEYGRVVDTLRFFSIEENAENLGKLKLSPYTRRKWERMINVYGQRNSDEEYSSQ